MGTRRGGLDGLEPPFPIDADVPSPVEELASEWGTPGHDEVVQERPLGSGAHYEARQNSGALDAQRPSDRNVRNFRSSRDVVGSYVARHADAIFLPQGGEVLAGLH